MSLSKLELRHNALEHRKQLRLTHEVLDAFARNFREAVPLSKGKIIASYMPMGSEFDVTDLSFTLMEEGYNLCLPVVHEKSKELVFYSWEKDMDFVQSPLGVMEPVLPKNAKPVLPDILCVPLLAFDQKGYRLGYGGGFYDATLTALRKNKEVTAVGVGFAEQACLFNLPREDHDAQMDYVITSAHVMDFTKSI